MPCRTRPFCVQWAANAAVLASFFGDRGGHDEAGRGDGVPKRTGLPEVGEAIWVVWDSASARLIRSPSVSASAIRPRK